jgi:hypothetical protein
LESAVPEFTSAHEQRGDFSLVGIVDDFDTPQVGSSLELNKWSVADNAPG